MGQESANSVDGAGKSSGSGAAEATTLRGETNDEHGPDAEGARSGERTETRSDAEDVTGDSAAGGASEDARSGSEAAAGADEEQSTQPSDDGAPSASLSLDVVFEIAKNERRRRVLEYLEGREEPVKLGELAEHIAALENDKPVKQLTSAERKRVYVGLYQCHLPKMDGAGVVNFDRNPGITLGANAEQVTRYLDPPRPPDPRWPQLYLTEALLGLSVVVLAGTLVGGVAAAIGAGALALAMLVTAIGHARDVSLPAFGSAGEE